VPDLRGFAAANNLDGKSDDEIRAEMGDKFPKHIYHSIACIGALIAHHDGDDWVVDALGDPHVGERTEKELIAHLSTALNVTSCGVSSARRFIGLNAAVRLVKCPPCLCATLLWRTRCLPT
jgi:hypothetical protein